MKYEIGIYGNPPVVELDDDKLYTVTFEIGTECVEMQTFSPGLVVAVGGPPGKDSTVPGPEGKSAYQVAVDNGFAGTEAQWLQSLKGDAGTAPLLFGHLVVGYHLDTGQPDTATQSKINILLAAGVSPIDIIWADLGLLYIGSGSFAMAIDSAGPQFGGVALLGALIGALAMPSFDCSPAVGNIPFIGGPGLGSFDMPGVPVILSVSVPSLIGVTVGTFAMPTLFTLPAMSVPVLTASMTPIVLSSSGLISFDDWASGSLGSWSTLVGSPAVVDVNGNNKLLVGTTTGGQLSRSFAAVSGAHILMQKQAIGTSTASEGAYDSVIIVAPNGTDNYRCMFDTRVSSTLPKIKKNNVNMVTGNPPIGATDNASHDYEAIVSSTGIDIYVDGTLYAHLTDTAFTSFSQVILTGSSATGSAGHGAYFDNVTICRSKNITCSGSEIKTGYKLRVGGASGKTSTAAGSNGATLTVDCSGIRTRQSLVEILDGSNNIVGTLTDTNNVYPGSAYTYG